MYEYKAKITRVVDGDTVDATLDLGFGITFKMRLRIDGFDAPETWRPSCEEELKHGLQATHRANELLLGKDVVVKTSKLGIYGRYGASITIPEGDYATVMITEGLQKLDEYWVEDNPVIVS